MYIFFIVYHTRICIDISNFAYDFMKTFNGMGCIFFKSQPQDQGTTSNCSQRACACCRTMSNAAATCSLGADGHVQRLMFLSVARQPALWTPKYLADFQEKPIPFIFSINFL